MGEEGPVNMTVDCLTDDRRPFQKRRPSLLYFYFLRKKLTFSTYDILRSRSWIRSWTEQAQVKHGFGCNHFVLLSYPHRAPHFFSYFFVPFRDLQSNFRLNRFLRRMANYNSSQCQSPRRRYSITISMIGLQVLVMLDAPRVVDSLPNVENAKTGQINDESGSVTSILQRLALVTTPGCEQAERHLDPRVELTEHGTPLFHSW